MFVAKRDLRLAQRESARRKVLEKLGLTELVSTDFIDIAAGHRQHLEQQKKPARFLICLLYTSPSPRD